MTERILVTGGAGYIGSHTAKALARAGYEPVVFDNLVYGHESAVRWGPLFRGDLSDRDAISRAFEQYRVSGVIHFAAYAYVGESVGNPRKYFENNLAGTLNLLGCMLDRGVKTIVFSSTCATYGTPERTPIAEDHPQMPINPYGETKLAVERALRWYGSAYGLGWAALRYFNAAGADAEGEIGEDHDPETHLIPLALDAATGHGPALQILGTDYDTPDGTAIRDYVHVSDLADAHLHALTHLREKGESGAFNLGTGVGSSVREVIAAVERTVGGALPVAAAPRRPGDPAVLVADPEKARRVLGWQTRHSGLDNIVRSAWNWHNGRRAAADA